MESAGSSVASEVVRLLSKRSSAAVVCGSGNNGADGLVVARKLTSLGYPVDVFLVDPKPFSSPEGETNRRLLEKYNQRTFTLPSIFAEDTFMSYAVIVDAVLGAGFNPARKPDDRLNTIFTAINASPAMTVAVDIPSGVDPSTGAAVYANPVMADVTVTFGTVKAGLVLYPGRRFCGRLVMANLSFPPSACSSVSMWLNPVPEFNPRDPEGHKGSFGKAAFVAGSSQYFGAPLLSSKSFLKSGGGYSKLFTVEEVARVVAVAAPEVVIICDPTASMAGNDVVVVGPGLGLDHSSQERFNAAIEQVCAAGMKTVVIDGDGLTLLASDFTGILTKLSDSKVKIVLTPHVGEWKRLFPESEGTGSVIDLVAATKTRLSEMTLAVEVIVVIKGPSTCIVSSLGETWINVTGNSGMGTCGSGDVLAGIIAAILCNPPVSQEDSSSLMSAVSAAVFVHGLAGDIAAESKGQDGLMASDIMESVPAAILRIRIDACSVQQRYLPRVI